MKGTEVVAVAGERFEVERDEDVGLVLV